MIEALKNQCAHSIRLVQRADPQYPSNCFQYTFGVDLKIVHETASLLDRLFVSGAFVEEWIIPELQEVALNSVSSGYIIIYFNDELPTHSGTFQHGRIISKWGQGHIFEHAIEEVPINYGLTFRYYAKISPIAATRNFIRFVQQDPDYGAIQELFQETVQEWKVRTNKS